MRSLTAEWVDWAVSLRYDDLPKEAIDASKTSILDTVGVTLAGSQEEVSRRLLAYILSLGSTPQASAVGHSAKTSTAKAALLNGTAADALGFSDVTPALQNHHPSAPVLAAALAVAEEVDATGRDLILAHVIGVELSCKLARLVPTPFSTDRGWHPVSILGGFGAAIAAGKLLQLDRGRMSATMGLAGMMVCGTKACMGTMAKSYSRGHAAEGGVEAAHLALHGLSGPSAILEGRDGFFHTFGDGHIPNEYAPLGDPYEIVAPGFTFKAYPSCTCSHTLIDALRHLMAESPFTADDVDGVDCYVSPTVDNYLRFHSPTNPLEAKYSLEYCAATVLVRGTVEVQSFAPAALYDPQLRRLMDRVTTTVVSEFDPVSAPYGSFVQVKLKDGRILEHRQPVCAWDPTTPPSWAEVLEKYRSCARLALAEDRIALSAHHLRDLDDGSVRVRDLTAAVSPVASSGL